MYSRGQREFWQTQSHNWLWRRFWELTAAWQPADRTTASLWLQFRRLLNVRMTSWVTARKSILRPLNETEASYDSIKKWNLWFEKVRGWFHSVPRQLTWRRKCDGMGVFSWSGLTTCIETERYLEQTQPPLQNKADQQLPNIYNKSLKETWNQVSKER